MFKPRNEVPIFSKPETLPAGATRGSAQGTHEKLVNIRL